jgi:predicted Zn-dependent protease
MLMDVAAIYRQRGQHDRCLTTLHHLLDTFPHGEQSQQALWMEGLALMDLGRSQQAVESLTAASQQGPPNADLLYYLAQAELAAGRPAEAAEAVQQALAANAAHEPSHLLQVELAGRVEAQTLLR